MMLVEEVEERERADDAVDEIALPKKYSRI